MKTIALVLILAVAAPAAAAEPGTASTLEPAPKVETAEAPKPLPPEVLAALDDAAVSRGWSGAFKTLGVLGLAGSIVGAIVMARQTKTEKDSRGRERDVSAYSGGEVFARAGGAALGSGILLGIGALIDHGARADLRAVGIVPQPRRPREATRAAALEDAGEEAWDDEVGEDQADEDPEGEEE